MKILLSNFFITERRRDSYNGLPVYNERVNRYTVNFLHMLTTRFFYGNMTVGGNVFI